MVEEELSIFDIDCTEFVLKNNEMKANQHPFPVCFSYSSIEQPFLVSVW